MLREKIDINAYILKNKTKPQINSLILKETRKIRSKWAQVNSRKKRIEVEISNIYTGKMTEIINESKDGFLWKYSKVDKNLFRQQEKKRKYSYY